MAEEAGTTVAELLRETEFLVHGQTMATNALIQRNGPVIGLLCTQGLRDIMYLGRGGKPERFNIHLQKPEDFIPRYLRLGIPERTGADGSEVLPLDEEAVRAAAQRLGAHGVKAVAVAYLWSIVDPSHEKRTARDRARGAARRRCAVLPAMSCRRFASGSAPRQPCCPPISRLLSATICAHLRKRWRLAACPHPPQIMQVNGGCASVLDLLARPVNAVASGPAAGPAAGAHYASDTKAPDRLIIIDMGGTSFDVCMLRDSEPVMSTDIKVAHQPIGVNGVEVLSIGAGGGSIAWLDSGKALRVGPQSAGSQPGPACYGRGGRAPAVTDANLAVGRMSPGAFLGGRRSLDEHLAHRAIAEHIATPLGLSVREAAAGILTIVNSNMASAIRAVSIERGIDPRDYVMVAGGGAGGLHAAELARMLEIGEVLIPRSAGGLCAFGMAVTPCAARLCAPPPLLYESVRRGHGHRPGV